MDSPIKLAVVGCGAISELAHLPAMAAVREGEVRVLVDSNRSRAEALARKAGIPNVCERVDDIVGKVDAAIVALPPHLHSGVSIELLRRGIHVLVEKPMALTTAQCDEMIRAAQDGKSVLSVGHMRRFEESAGFAKAILQSGMLGEIESFDIRDGFVFGWPITSESFFRRDLSGGGVLFEFGVHALDCLLWWLGDVATLEYFDDSYGGVEADCEVHLTMKNGVRGIVEMSRTRNLRNTAVFEGKNATLEVSLHGPKARLRTKGLLKAIDGDIRSETMPVAGLAPNLIPFVAQLRDWLGAIRNGTEPLVSGVQGRRCIALAEACYRQRKLLDLPWMKPVAEVAR